MAETPKRVALIPARGGSKRLPGKNLLAFGGKPLLAWSIECARASGLFERICVSSEDADIGACAKSFGAEWFERDPALAGDKIEMDPVCLDFIEREQAAGRDFDLLAILLTTAPLRAVEDIANVVQAVEGGATDFAMAVTDYPYSPFEALAVDGDNRARLMWPEYAKKSRQDRPHVMVDAGSVYAVRASAYLEVRTVYGPGLKVIEVPAERAVDIDTAADMARAEFYRAERERA